jgi:hypothetical protein
MKHDAIVEQGIPILERVPIPDDMIPEDSRVEIDAKIHAGYCKFGQISLVVFVDSRFLEFGACMGWRITTIGILSRAWCGM